MSMSLAVEPDGALHLHQRILSPSLISHIVFNMYNYLIGDDALLAL
jgi:hypothetical protein